MSTPLHSSQPVGGASNKNPSRPISFHANDFASVEQGQPLPVIYGTQISAGVIISPIWGFYSVEEKTNAGGK